MEFLQKMLFYVMYGMTCLVVIFLLFNAAYSSLYPPIKYREAIIFLLASFILIAGLYFGYQAIKESARYGYGALILLIDWIATILFIVVCFFAFIPFRWQ